MKATKNVQKSRQRQQRNEKQKYRKKLHKKKIKAFRCKQPNRSYHKKYIAKTEKMRKMEQQKSKTMRGVRKLRMDLEQVIF